MWCMSRKCWFAPSIRAYSLNYVHNFVVLCFDLLTLTVAFHLCIPFTNLRQVRLAGTWATISVGHGFNQTAVTIAQPNTAQREPRTYFLGCILCGLDINSLENIQSSILQLYWYRPKKYVRTLPKIYMDRIFTIYIPNVTELAYNWIELMD